jgi:hypothetical protein
MKSFMFVNGCGQTAATEINGALASAADMWHDCETYSQEADCKMIGARTGDKPEPVISNIHAPVSRRHLKIKELFSLAEFFRLFLGVHSSVTVFCRS